MDTQIENTKNVKRVAASSKAAKFIDDQCESDVDLQFGLTAARGRTVPTEAAAA